VVKSQPTDIIDIILSFIKHPNGVHMACSDRKSRDELLSTAEVQWSTTKSDGMWESAVTSRCLTLVASGFPHWF
jgi:hypothetical protein